MFGFTATGPKSPKLDQQRISEILGSTMEPVGPGGPIDAYMRMKYGSKDAQPCLHDGCTECHGTGRKERDGSACVHMISCPCSKCNLATM